MNLVVVLSCCDRIFIIQFNRPIVSIVQGRGPEAEVRFDICREPSKHINLVQIEKDKIEVRESTPNISNKNLEESIVKLGLSIRKEKK